MDKCQLIDIDMREQKRMKCNHTGHGSLPGHFRQRRVDQLLEVHLLVLDVEERLAGADGRFAEPQRADGLVPIQRLKSKRLQRLFDVLRRHDLARCFPHGNQGVMQKLCEAKLDILRHRLANFVGEATETHRLGDIANVLRVPDGHLDELLG